MTEGPTLGMNMVQKGWPFLLFAQKLTAPMSRFTGADSGEIRRLQWFFRSACGFQVTIALSEVPGPSCIRRRKGTDCPVFCWLVSTTRSHGRVMTGWKTSASSAVECPWASVAFINCQPTCNANTLSGYGRTSRWQLASICQKTGLSSGWSSTAYRHQVEANGHSGPSGA